VSAVANTSRHLSSEIAVVGGSAAGLYTALELARRGRSVSVLESAPMFNALPRTLIVTSHYRKFLGSAADKSIVNEIRQFELFADGRATTVPLREPDLIIERAQVIQALAEDCANAGVEVATGHRMTGLRTAQDGVTLQGECQGSTFEVTPKVLVGADGAFSAVARQSGWGRMPTAPLVQAVVELPAGFPRDTTRVWFVPEDTPYFYWLIPESSGRGVLGLIGEDGSQTRRCLQRFLAQQKMTAIEYQAARVPIYQRWTPVHRRFGPADVYLVGDAAGHVKVTTVGGIVTGFRGALGVVEAIMKGGPGRELRLLRQELDLHLRVRRMLNRFALNDYRRLVDLMSAPVLEVLGSVPRDEARRMLMKLCLTQPALLAMGVRAMFQDWVQGPALGPERWAEEAREL